MGLLQIAVRSLLLNNIQEKNSRIAWPCKIRKCSVYFWSKRYTMFYKFLFEEEDGEMSFKEVLMQIKGLI